MNYAAFHKLTYGLYLIATEHKGEKVGYVANTAFQVSAEPSQIAISCNKDNYSAQKILESKSFSISVLKKEVDTSLIGKFGFMSGAHVEKFDGVETIRAKTGAPIVVNSSLAWFDCKVITSVDVGTHHLIIAEVLDGDVLSDEEPLTYEYYHAKYKMRSPKNAPTYISEDKLPEAIKKELSDDALEGESSLSEGGGVYSCNICGYQYDSEQGEPAKDIAPGTPFEDLPDDYICPICSAGKDYFTKIE